MTLGSMTLSINALGIMTQDVVFLLVLLSVDMPSVVMPNDVMVNVAAPKNGSYKSDQNFGAHGQLSRSCQIFRIFPKNIAEPKNCKFIEFFHKK
jgi:hypothetical protein